MNPDHPSWEAAEVDQLGVAGVIEVLCAHPQRGTNPVIHLVSPLFNSALWMRNVDEMTDDHGFYGRQLYYVSAATSFGLLGRQGLGFLRSYGIFMILLLAADAGLSSHTMFVITTCSAPFTKLNHNMIFHEAAA
jgi:hypothetical protein